MLIRNVSDTKTVLRANNVKVICELPIYGTTQKGYNEYWEKRTDEYIQKCLINSPQRDDINMLRASYLKDTIWKYNQIFGYIRVSVNDAEVIFENFLSFKNYRRNSNAKHKIEFNGDFHFYIGNLKTNTEIISRIKEYMDIQIKDIKKRHPRYYVDNDAFDSIIDYLDIKAIISSL